MKTRFRILATVVAALLLVAACAATDPVAEPDLAIASTREYVDASVFIDGVRVGQLRELVRHDSLYARYLRWRYPGSPAHDIASLSVVLDSERMAPGTHHIRVEKPGHDPLATEFSYPLHKFEILFPEPIPSAGRGPT